VSLDVISKGRECVGHGSASSKTGVNGGLPAGVRGATGFWEVQLKREVAVQKWGKVGKWAKIGEGDQGGVCLYLSHWVSNAGKKSHGVL